MGDRCAECGGKIIFIDNTHVCETCGIVQEKIVFEQGTFSIYPRSRCSHYFPLHANVKNSRIGRQYNNPRIYYLDKKYNKVRKYMTELKEIVNNVCNRLEISYLRDDIFYDLQKMIKTRKIHNKIALIGTLVYFHTQKRRIPIPVQKIIQEMQDGEHKFTKRILNHNIRDYQLNIDKKITYRDYIPQIQSKLSSNKQIQDRCQKYHISPQLFQKLLRTPLPIRKRMNFRGYHSYYFAAGVIFARIKWACKQLNISSICVTYKLFSQGLEIPEHKFRDQYLKNIFPNIRHTKPNHHLQPQHKEGIASEL